MLAFPFGHTFYFWYLYFLMIRVWNEQAVKFWNIFIVSAGVCAFVLRMNVHLNWFTVLSFHTLIISFSSLYIIAISFNKNLTNFHTFHLSLWNILYSIFYKSNGNILCSQLSVKYHKFLLSIKLKYHKFHSFSDNQITVLCIHSFHSVK